MSKYPGSKRQLKALPPAVGGQWRQPVHRASHLGLKCLGLLLLASASVLSTTEEWKPKRAPQTGEGDPQPPGKVRAAVCFYGLTRSLQWTLPSIRGRLFDALRHEGMEVDVFVHTYHLLEVNNKRAGEENITYGSYEQDFQLLNATRALVTNQDDFDLAWPNPISLSYYKWGYASDWAPAVVRNVFRAYWSMSEVWGLMAQFAAENDFDYDAVILARPDVWFHVDIDLPSRQFPLPETCVYVPDFDYGGNKTNDRFAYGSTTAMRVLMHRIATFFDPNSAALAPQVNSEWVLGHHLRSNGIEVVPLTFPLTRVRMTGDIPTADHHIVEEACSSGDDAMACDIVKLDFKFPVEGGGGGGSG